MLSKDWKILKEYTERYDLRPQLSQLVAGEFTFLKRDGSTITVGMTAMKKDIEAARKEDKQS